MEKTENNLSSELPDELIIPLSLAKNIANYLVSNPHNEVVDFEVVDLLNQLQSLKPLQK